ncbi:MAG: hypothetical protein ABIH59_03505 [archaeon]
MKIEKKYWIFGIVVLVVLFIMIFRFGGEDSWIKDERGVWVKHGVPSETPEKVLEQQQLIEGVLELYRQKKSEGMEFNSQCIGIVENYAVDIVHFPRTEEDNLVESQCEVYRLGEVSNFIELDRGGNIIRIVD